MKLCVVSMHCASIVSGNERISLGIDMDKCFKNIEEKTGAR